MKHLTNYKLFESHVLSIDNLDLIEIENFAIDYIDRGRIEITDINTPGPFSISEINQIIGRTYYNVNELNYPDGFGGKYKSKQVNLFDVLGNSKCVIFKVNLYDDGNRWNLDLDGYTRSYMKSIFGKIENKYNVDGYLIIHTTNIETSKPLSESVIILKERENKI
jgi:hypothetical protein